MRDILPIDSFLDGIVEAVSGSSSVILRASPGAGKTTRVAPALKEKLAGKIIMVEPRRVAAAGAARRISFENSEKCGEHTGYIVRGEKCCGKSAKIICVTTGIFLNMIVNDPELSGVDAVIFDEFHERSMQSDLGFTLALESQKLFSPDLKLIIMSATIDEKKFQKIIPDAVFFDVPGRVYPLEIEYNPESINVSNIVNTTVSGVIYAAKKHQGNILAFLPGTAEISRTFEALENFARLNDITLQQLHGRMKLEEQNLVLRGKASKRRIILATNIAESSVTVPGITAVVDSGFEKRLCHDAATGFDKLETVRISMESADQRAGRAGRTAPGFVYRLWSSFDNRAFIPHTEAEISSCDLTKCALTLADWGCQEDELSWVTAPDAARMSEARQLLFELGAIDSSGNITARGRKISALPVHPRIASVLVSASDGKELPLACETAAVLEEGTPVTLPVSEIIRSMRKKDRRFLRHYELARELMKMTDCSFNDSLSPENCSFFILAAYPDRVAKYNGKNYHFSGGSSAVMAPDSPDEGAAFLACAEVSNSGTAGVIRLWEKSSIDELRSVFKDSIREVVTSNFDSVSGKITARKEERLGELVLSTTPAPADQKESARAVIIEAFRRQIAVPAEKNSSAVRLKERVSFASRQGDERFPDWSNDEVWKDFLLNNLPGREKINSFSSLENADIFSIMQEFLGWELKCELDKSCPEKFTTPAGSSRYIDYSCDVPVLSVKVQEMFGVKVHPCVGKKRMPLKIDLLSPAMRSVQITGDLPRFWQSSWQLVRKDMKSRYPKHDWPEDPANAKPHTKVKPV